MAIRSFIIYRLYFTSPLHIGDVRPEDYGSTESFLHSDTLHAALMASWAKLGANIPVDGDPGFSLSSLFPFSTTEAGKPVYFFPKLRKSFQLGREPITFAKKLKKLQWLDQYYFECQLNDRPVQGFGGKKQPHLQNQFASCERLNKFIESQVSQRVTIPRQRDSGEEPTPFYMERLYFKKGSGLFFLFKGKTKDSEKLEKALHLLQYEGFGTDRTVGNGAFFYEKSTIELEVPNNCNYGASLSLFCPESKEQLEHMLGGESAYDFIKRGGWITTEGAQSLRKKAIYMFREGSVFQTTSSSAGRAAIDLSPEAEFKQLSHKIWRNGSSIFLPVKL